MLRISLLAVLLVLSLAARHAAADPCGMVPPAYPGKQIPLARVGPQKTYVFYKDGTETIVLRPGFQGSVDEFGMLIPFPTPPAIRKVPENIFPHIAAAIDPPEVVVDLRPQFFFGGMGGFGGGFGGGGAGGGFGGLEFELRKDEVRVLREEAVGMYEVAVLAAGSSIALRGWMVDHKYVYPDGMDDVCDHYIEDAWCFVAVKTKVGTRKDVDPRPGKKTVDNDLPEGAVFDGHVQAMGFRFRSDSLVVPMRLSAFNKGKLHNVVYLLADEPSRIRQIPEEYVMRQVTGRQLLKNLTGPLPVRVIGGDVGDIPRSRWRSIGQERDPRPHNGIAAELFAGDLIAAETGVLLSDHEQEEKELAGINEALGLRGVEIDMAVGESLADERRKDIHEALADVRTMTLSVIDGDFDREVLARENLTFARYRIHSRKNTRKRYDAKYLSAAPPAGGVLIAGELELPPETKIAVTKNYHLASPIAELGSVLVWIAVALILVKRLRYRHRHRKNA